MEGLIKVTQGLDWFFPESLERGMNNETTSSWPFQTPPPLHTTAHTHPQTGGPALQEPPSPSTWGTAIPRELYPSLEITYAVVGMGRKKKQFSGVRPLTTSGIRSWALAFPWPQGKEKRLSLCSGPTVFLKYAVTSFQFILLLVYP